MIGMARGTFLYTMTTKEKAFSKFCEHKQKNSYLSSSSVTDKRTVEGSWFADSTTFDWN